MARICPETALYTSKQGLTKIRSGRFCRAATEGMAERTPKRRASYEAAATTPRSRAPPTATGLPRRSGLSRCSTDAKECVHVDVDHLTRALRLTRNVRAGGRGGEF